MPVSGVEAERLFFRNWFINEEKEAYIARIIWTYFNAIKDKWPEAWGSSDYILTKSTGIIALMRFLKDIVSYYGIEKLISFEEFKMILDKIKLKDEHLVNDNYKAGGVGQADLYKDLKSQSEI